MYNLLNHSLKKNRLRMNENLKNMMLMLRKEQLAKNREFHALNTAEVQRISLNYCLAN